MITEGEVKTWMRENFLVGSDWLAPYFVAVAEACRKYAMNPDGLAAGIKSAIKQLAKWGEVTLPDQQISSILFDALNFASLLSEIPSEAKAIPVPPEPSGGDRESEAIGLMRELLLIKHADAISRLKRMRTIAAIQHGACLADHCCQLAGNFRWIPSGPDAGPQNTFKLKEHSSKTEDGGGGVKNHFAAWLNGKGPEPGASAHMNCWEAVFFSAFKAGLVSRERLITIHNDASHAAQKGASSAHYYETLIAAMGYQDAAPVIPDIGLVPMPGDIVFVAAEHHVAVCVEVRPDADSKGGVLVMSLWKHPSDTFQKIDISDFGGLIENVTFAPCPF